MHLGEVIIVFAPIFWFSGLKKQISREHFIHHASEWPNIRSLTVGLPEDNLRRSILSSLNLSRKMVMLPTCISQICNFHFYRAANILFTIEADFSFMMIEQTLPIIEFTLILILFSSLLLFLYFLFEIAFLIFGKILLFKHQI